MNKKFLAGLIMMFVTFLFLGVDLQLSEIARYICIMSGQEFTFHWYEFLNPVSIVCIIGNLLIAAYFLFAGTNEKKLQNENKCKEPNEE